MYEFLAEIGDTGSRCTVDGLLADVLVRMGRYEEATAFAAESRTIAGVGVVIVLILWLLGWLVFEVAGGLIHLLLVVALIVIVYRLVTGRAV